jgi:hypothetical protein
LLGAMSLYPPENVWCHVTSAGTILLSATAAAAHISDRCSAWVIPKGPSAGF